MPTRSPRPQRAGWFFAAAAIVFLSGTLPANSSADSVRIVIENPEELLAQIPDQELASDIVQALGEMELWQENSGVAGPVVTAPERVVLLVFLASPEPVESVQQKDTRIEVEPIDDFEAFIEAIDYGEIVKKDPQQRVVHLRINPSEISTDKLTSRGGPRTKNLPPMARARLLMLRSTTRKRISPPEISGMGLHAGEALGEKFELGDRVEIDLSGRAYQATVIEIDSGFRGSTAQIRIEPIDSLAENLRSRGLRTRLERAKSLTLTAPLSRLRRARVESPSGTGPRTWTDTSGRFRVEASFGGVEGEKVRLRKLNGKEILVPINRLAEQDRRLIEELLENANPFADPAPPDGVPGSLRADWSDAREIGVRSFLRWSFKPESRTPVKASVRKGDTLPVSLAGPGQKFPPNLGRLYVSGDGGAAIAVGDGRGLQSGYLQYLDFTKGIAHKPVKLPARSQLLDASPEQRLLILNPDRVAQGSERVYIYRLTETGIEPYADWTTSPPDAFHKDLTEAYLLPGGRVMTRGFHTGWVFWEMNTGKALHYLSERFAGVGTTTLDPSRRYAIVGVRKAVVILDLTAGEHVATIHHVMDHIANLAVNDEMTRLALWSQEDDLVACDLTSGEALFGLTSSFQIERKAEWMNDLLLIGNKYVVEPDYPILLWKYRVIPAGRDQLLTVNNGRLWYAPTSVDSSSPAAGSLFVSSIEAPHPAIVAARAALPKPEDLVILAPGDEVRLSIDTTLGPSVEAEIIESMSAALTESGFRVVNEMQAGEDTLDAVIVCKPSGERQVQIVTVDPDGPYLNAGPWARGTPVTLTPFESYVSIRRGSDELWSDVVRIQPGQRVYGRANETADQVIERITSPNVDRLLKMEFPSQICRRGNASPEGAYGVSILTSEGIAED